MIHEGTDKIKQPERGLPNKDINKESHHKTSTLQGKLKIKGRNIIRQQNSRSSSLDWTKLKQLSVYLFND